MILPPKGIISPSHYQEKGERKFTLVNQLTDTTQQSSLSSRFYKNALLFCLRVGKEM